MTDYKTCNLQIIKICEKICDLPFSPSPTGQVYDLSDLAQLIQNTVSKRTDELIKYYQEIINYLIVVYEGFEPLMHLVS